MYLQVIMIVVYRVTTRQQMEIVDIPGLNIDKILLGERMETKLLWKLL